MTNLAQDYGKLLFDFGYTREAVDSFYDTLKASKELLVALDNPTVVRATKHNIIDKVFSKEIAGFVKCLCDNNRITSYDEVYEVYRHFVEEKDGVIEATLFTTEKPTPQEMETFEAMLKNKYNKNKAKIEVVIDSSLIGGFILRVGDVEYNKSFKNAFDKLKRKYDWR